MSTVHPPVAPTTTPTAMPPSVHPDIAHLPGAMLTTAATRALAVLRVSTGFLFLWAFLDKTFGLRSEERRVGKSVL